MRTEKTCFFVSVTSKNFVNRCEPALKIMWTVVRTNWKFGKNPKWQLVNKNHIQFSRFNKVVLPLKHYLKIKYLYRPCSAAWHPGVSHQRLLLAASRRSEWSTVPVLRRALITTLGFFFTEEKSWNINFIGLFIFKIFQHNFCHLFCFVFPRKPPESVFFHGLFNGMLSFYD